MTATFKLGTYELFIQFLSICQGPGEDVEIFDLMALAAWHGLGHIGEGCGQSKLVRRFEGVGGTGGLRGACGQHLPLPTTPSSSISLFTLPRPLPHTPSVCCLPWYALCPHPPTVSPLLEYGHTLSECHLSMYGNMGPYGCSLHISWVDYMYFPRWLPQSRHHPWWQVIMKHQTPLWMSPFTNCDLLYGIALPKTRTSKTVAITVKTLFLARRLVESACALLQECHRNPQLDGIS